MAPAPWVAGSTALPDDGRMAETQEARQVFTPENARDLARLVMVAEGLREESYEEGSPVGTYGMGLREAATEAVLEVCGKRDAVTETLVWLLLVHAWNDVQEWAKS